MRMFSLGLILLISAVFVLAIGGCVDARTQTDNGSTVATIDEYAKTIIDHPETAVANATKIRKLAAAAAVSTGTPLADPIITTPAAIPAPTVAPTTPANP